MEPTLNNAHTAETSHAAPLPIKSQYERDLEDLLAVIDGIANAVTTTEQFHAIEADLHHAALWQAGGHLINSRDLAVRCQGYAMLLTAIIETPHVLDRTVHTLLARLESTS